MDPEEAQDLLGTLYSAYEDYLEDIREAEERASEDRRALTDSLISEATRRFNDVAQSLNNALLSNTIRRLDLERIAVRERFDFEEQSLKALQENGIVNATQYERELEKIKRRRILEENRLAEAQFDAEQRNSLAQVAIQTAINVSRVLYNPVLAGIVLAGGLAQAAIVNSQEFTPIAYAEGGLVEGPSHAEGGVPFTVRGNSGYEMEGNEFIVNKVSTSEFLPLLEDINNWGNNRPYNNRYFQGGGLLGGLSSNRAEELLEALVVQSSRPFRAYVTSDDVVGATNTYVDNDIRSNL